MQTVVAHIHGYGLAPGARFEPRRRGQVTTKGTKNTKMDFDELSI
jgi:hypothetical protein